MPGFFSQMFDGEQDGEGQQHFGVEHATDIEQDVGVHTDLCLSYQDADGTTQTYSSSHDVEATIGVHALTAVVVDTAEGFGAG